MLQWRNWTATKAILFEFSIFNGNHEIADKALEQKIKESNLFLLLLEDFREACCLH